MVDLGNDVTPFDLEALTRAPYAPIAFAVMAASVSGMLTTTKETGPSSCLLTLTPSDAAAALHLVTSMFGSVATQLGGFSVFFGHDVRVPTFATPILDATSDVGVRDSSDAFVHVSDADPDVLRSIVRSVVTFAHPDNHDVDIDLMDMTPSVASGLRIITTWANSLGVSISPMLAFAVRNLASHEIQF